MKIFENKVFFLDPFFQITFSCPHNKIKSKRMDRRRGLAVGGFQHHLDLVVGHDDHLSVHRGRRRRPVHQSSQPLIDSVFLECRLFLEVAETNNIRSLLPSQFAFCSLHVHGCNTSAEKRDTLKSRGTMRCVRGWAVFVPGLWSGGGVSFCACALWSEHASPAPLHILCRGPSRGGT